MKPKFDEKEKVLCFEPDITKARVLYDATVVQIEISEKKQTSYLVHFKNWNNAHDRWVCEDLILKVNKDNRLKQEELAESLIKKSKTGQLRPIPGIDSTRTLVKKEREERLSARPIRRTEERKSYSSGDHESDEDYQPKHQVHSPPKTPQTVTQSKQTNMYEDDLYVPIHLDEKLVHHLEEDFVLINKKNKLIKLPAELNVVQILENFVRHFAANMTNVPIVGTRTEPEIRNEGVPEMGQYTLELAMEVVDDLRILFDFMLPLILLYGPERQQYKRLRENATLANEIQVSSPTQSEPPDKENCSVNTEKINKRASNEKIMNPKKRAKTAEADLLDYNRKYLIREGDLKNTGIVKCDDGTRRSSRSSTVIQSKGSRGIQNAMKPPKLQAETPADKRMTRRRQLSHDCCIDLSPKVFVRRTSLTQIQSLTKAAVKTREGGEKGFVDQGTGQTPTSAGAGTAGEVKEEPDNKDNKHLTNTNGDDVNPMEHLTPSQFSDANEIRRAISLNNIWKWRMLPAEYVPEVVPPSLIFGAQHLLRLFVKLPEILGRMRIEEKRLTMLLKFITGFLDFLVTYEKDLFTDLAYEKYVDL